MEKIDGRNVQQGDVYWITLNPTAGHEQRGVRPVLVVSNDIVNSKLVLALVIPITNTDKGHPLHIPIPEGLEVTGFVKCEEIRAVDLKSRNAKYITHCAGEDFFQDCLSIIGGLF